MRTFYQKFKDKIDMSDGTVVLDEVTYKDIQKEALQEAIKIITNDGEYGLTTCDMIDKLVAKMETL